MNTLYISKAASDKLWGYTLATSDEIGGFGYATRDGEGEWLWYETFLVPQQASAGEVDFMEEGIPHAIDKAHTDNVFEDPNFMWVKWHSHHTMGAYWSSQDDDANDKMRHAGLPYFVDVVVNHKREAKVRLELYECPLDIPQITLDDVKLVSNPADEFNQGIYLDMGKFVRKPPKKEFTGFTKPKGKTDNRPGDKLEEAFEQAGYGGFSEQAWGLDDPIREAIESEGYDIVVGNDGKEYVMDSGEAIAELTATTGAAT